MAIESGVGLGPSEASSGSRVGMIEIVGFNDDPLAGTASPEGNKENKRNDGDGRVEVGTSVDDSDVGERIG